MPAQGRGVIDFSDRLVVEVTDTVVPAYQIRYHLSATDKQVIGLDTMEIVKFYFTEDGKKRYIKYQEVTRITSNSKCYHGYYDERIPCRNLLGY